MTNRFSGFQKCGAKGGLLFAEITGELEQADSAYKAAYETEPTNAQVLWDRAQNLRQAGKQVEAARLFRQIADGRWQPRFQGVQTQARLQIR